MESNLSDNLGLKPRAQSQSVHRRQANPHYDPLIYLYPQAQCNEEKRHLNFRHDIDSVA